MKKVLTQWKTPQSWLQKAMEKLLYKTKQDFYFNNKLMFSFLETIFSMNFQKTHVEKSTNCYRKIIFAASNHVEPPWWPLYLKTHGSLWKHENNFSI